MIGKIVHSQNLVTDINKEIKELDGEKHTSILELRKAKAYIINK
jgi:hypothetical protein